MQEHKYLGVIVRWKRRKLASRAANWSLYRERLAKIQGLKWIAMNSFKMERFKWCFTRAYLLAVQRGMLYVTERALFQSMANKTQQGLNKLYMEMSKLFQQLKITEYRRIKQIPYASTHQYCDESNTAGVLSKTHQSYSI